MAHRRYPSAAERHRSPAGAAWETFDSEQPEWRPVSGASPGSAFRPLVACGRKEITPVTATNLKDLGRVRLALRGKLIEFLEHVLQVSPGDDENDDV